MGFRSLSEPDTQTLEYAWVNKDISSPSSTDGGYLSDRVYFIAPEITSSRSRHSTGAQEKRIFIMLSGASVTT